MSKRKYFIIIILLLMLNSSCLPESQEPPSGIWKSEEPNIIMYFKPEYRNVPLRLAAFNHLAVYYANGSASNVFILSGPGRRVSITNDIKVRSNGTYYTYILIGDWRLRREQLYLTPTPAFQEKLGVETIIFNRLEDYPEINHEDWITEHIAYLIERQSLQE